MKKVWLSFLCICSLAACEKTISIQPDLQLPKLVVEAQIENGMGPTVVLSNSLNYFSEIDTAALNASFVHGAKVTISDGSTCIYSLKEFSSWYSPVATKFYYYATNQSSPSTSLFGGFGKKYDLTIETGGQVYTASTSIPLLTKKNDSLWWKKAPGSADTNSAVLMSRVTDPPGLGNYIRYFTRVNREAFFPGYNSVYDDQVIDGKTYDIQVDQGVSKNEVQKREDRGFFKRGDTVTVKLCNIDKASYDFWRTWEFSYQSIGNPFSSPGKITSNISNGGLGSFCGYAAQYSTLIIPK
jgi:hypothetical protein